jgi:transcription initiation factor IIE alpha subunit
MASLEYQHLPSDPDFEVRNSPLRSKLNEAMLEKNKPLAGFRCWYCGRPLEERTNWELFEEQFYCNALCRDADEHRLIFEEESVDTAVAVKRKTPSGDGAL